MEDSHIIYILNKYIYIKSIKNAISSGFTKKKKKIIIINK